MKGLQVVWCGEVWWGVERCRVKRSADNRAGRISFLQNRGQS